MVSLVGRFLRRHLFEVHLGGDIRLGEDVKLDGDKEILVVGVSPGSLRGSWHTVDNILTELKRKTLNT